jgi:hypothetical protein
MRSGVSHRVLLSIATLLFVCDARAQEVSYAWWLKATFIPRHTSIEGIPVHALNKDWARASVITASDLPKDSHQPGEGVEEHGFDLSFEGDLDGDGVPERALVGVFETISGETGEFLLILGRARPAQAWRKRAVFTERGTAGFSAVTLRKGRRLAWVTCFECDTGCEVFYRQGRFQRRCYSCC